ncbi:MarR family winged helix-turn-helix transcriptional regulator [Cohnella sp. REN36]|uniref:MarR family winged helix-turn-helix transcriptional regulator n=1 Tax=Cohnella sp. REN36 TaxID=2887347 RepID=UPI001D14A5E4|nr:MarR family transcriptional regulator [Cohnella sp. REN36]MCC3376080.1 MarR family transcriptional regulator [Cohnella sp. REN36]
MLNREERLAELMSAYMNRIVAGYAKMLEKDLTAPQFLIMQILASRGVCNCSEIAAALDITLPAVTNLANKLVRKGYIERLTSESDRRAVFLRLTDDGRQVEQRLQDRYKELTSGMWQDLSDNEMDALIGGFEKMMTRFPGMNPFESQGGQKHGKTDE